MKLYINTPHVTTDLLYQFAANISLMGIYYRMYYYIDLTKK